MPYDSAATKKRLIDAAFDEFAERGLAGARVDRIAAAASANKQAIYAYFGSKDDLFRAVLAERCDAIFDAVPFDPTDLPSFAGGLFDYFLENPRIVRMNLWRQLELPGEPEHESVTARVRALASAYNLGARQGEQLFQLVLGLATASFSIASCTPTAKDAAARARLAASRCSVVKATSAIVDTMVKKT